MLLMNAKCLGAVRVKTDKVNTYVIVFMKTHPLYNCINQTTIFQLVKGVLTLDNSYKSY